MQFWGIKKEEIENLLSSYITNVCGLKTIQNTNMILFVSLPERKLQIQIKIDLQICMYIVTYTTKDTNINENETKTNFIN